MSKNALDRLGLVDLDGDKLCFYLMLDAAERGKFIVGDDGYFFFAPSARSGGCDEGYLRWLADKLDELNAPWHAQVSADLERLK